MVVNSDPRATSPVSPVRTDLTERAAERSPRSLLASPSTSPFSGVSWGAIFAGAAGAAALSLILLILGTGLGLSAVSPWAQEGMSAKSFTVSTIAWVLGTQLLAAVLGGYLAGRLRGQWLDLHTDEVYFRDTAHGFLAWAIATLASAALLSATITSIVGGGVQMGASVTKAGTEAAVDMVPMNYVVESLFRQPATTKAPLTNTAPNNMASNTTNNMDRDAVMGEVTSIFMNTLRTGELPAEDQRYVGQLVAQRTGLSEAEATLRVNEGYNRAQTALRNAETTARTAADAARKATAHASLWLFIALLSGAFIASLAATFGGRQRDL